jgi:hypothetical protein
MRKAAVQKTLFTKDNYKLALKLVKASGLPYKITRTNYTLKIESELLSVHYLTSMMTDWPMRINKLIVKDIKESEIEKPVIEKSQLKYFSFNELSILERAKGKQVFNIDIKSAYVNALNNYGLLREYTYDRLCKMDKQDRLAALGMLASSYDIFEFDGVNKDPKEQTFTKDTEVWFLLAVLEIQNLMLDIINLIGSDFLFFWVDGIFFTNEDHKVTIENYLREKNYNNSYEQCYSFRYWKEGNVKYLSYWKESKDGQLFELKQLNLPTMDKEAKDFVIKFCKLIDKDGDNNSIQVQQDAQDALRAYALQLE